MDHSEQKTLCCGEGGAVGFLSPNLAKRWGLLRKKEVSGRKVITYCAGCSEFIGPLTPTSHILDIVFEPEAAMAGTVKVSKSPFTYLNRLKLKKQLKKRISASIIRERTFTVGKEEAR
jgi:hypothetical protein